MRRKLQFAGWMLLLGMSAAATAPSYAQKPGAQTSQNRPSNKAPNPPKQQGNQQRQQPRQAQNQRQAGRPQNGNANRPPERNSNRPNTTARPNNNPNRPPSAYTPPPARKFDRLPPQEQQRILQNKKNFEKLPPAQRQQREEAARNWTKLTPEQQSHIRNDVIPKWKQMPKDRQDAIQHRLAVLRNMPESARNQHLNDPNFTRGMSEEDRGMLRDLSHMHVGGAPEPPSE
jgi:hypothetical protein